MTREEIIQAISDDQMMPFIQPEQLAQIVAFVINNYQPSLPSNIDEAAEEYANTHYGEFFEVEYEFGDPIETIVDDKPFVRDAFKSGAEWMAEQGETVFDTIVIDGQGQRWLTDTPLLGDYDYGEEVIIQVRKKQ